MTEQRQLSAEKRASRSAAHSASGLTTVVTLLAGGLVFVVTAPLFYFAHRAVMRFVRIGRPRRL